MPGTAATRFALAISPVAFALGSRTTALGAKRSFDEAGGPKSAKSLHRKNAAPRAARLGGTHHVSVAVCKFAAVSFTRNQDSKAPT
jgi:hypothetical protein